MSDAFKLRNGSLMLSIEAAGGIYNSEQLKAIASLCDDGIAIVKVTEDQRLALFVTEDQAEAIIDQLSDIGLGVRNYRRGLHQPTACIGEFCEEHKQDAQGSAMSITEEIAEIELKTPLRIGVNGCSTCCVPCHTLDISIMGDDNGYRISIGGKNTQIAELATFVAEGVPDSELPGLLRQILELYRDTSEEGETLQDLIERNGTAAFIKILDPYSQDAASDGDTFSSFDESGSSSSTEDEAVEGSVEKGDLRSDHVDSSVDETPLDIDSLVSEDESLIPPENNEEIEGGSDATPIATLSDEDLQKEEDVLDFESDVDGAVESSEQELEEEQSAFDAMDDSDSDSNDILAAENANPDVLALDSKNEVEIDPSQGVNNSDELELDVPISSEREVNEIGMEGITLDGGALSPEDVASPEGGEAIESGFSDNLAPVEKPMDFDADAIDSKTVEAGSLAVDGNDASEINSVELSSSKNDTVEIDDADGDASEINSVEIDSSELDGSEIEDAENDDSELGSSEIDDSELGSSEIDDSEIGSSEIDDSEIGSSEIEDSEIGSSEIEDSEIDESEIGSSEIEDSEIDESEIGSSEIEDSEISNIESDSLEDDSDDELTELDGCEDLDNLHDLEGDLDPEILSRVEQDVDDDFEHTFSDDTEESHQEAKILPTDIRTEAINDKSISHKNAFDKEEAQHPIESEAVEQTSEGEVSFEDAASVESSPADEGIVVADVPMNQNPPVENEPEGVSDIDIEEASEEDEDAFESKFNEEIVDSQKIPEEDGKLEVDRSEAMRLVENDDIALESSSAEVCSEEQLAESGLDEDLGFEAEGGRETEIVENHEEFDNLDNLDNRVEVENTKDATHTIESQVDGSDPSTVRENSLQGKSNRKVKGTTGWSLKGIHFVDSEFVLEFNSGAEVHLSPESVQQSGDRVFSVGGQLIAVYCDGESVSVEADGIRLVLPLDEETSESEIKEAS